MALWVDTALAEVTRLTEQETGCYFRLLLRYSQQRGPLPDDDAELARLAGTTCAKWRSARPHLERLFVVGEGVWRHEHLDHELARWALKSATAKTNVSKRWRRERPS